MHSLIFAAFRRGNPCFHFIGCKTDSLPDLTIQAMNHRDLFSYDRPRVAKWQKKDWDTYIAKGDFLDPAKVKDDSTPYLYVFEKCCLPDLERPTAVIQSILDEFKEQQHIYVDAAIETSDYYIYSEAEANAIDEVGELIYAKAKPTPVLLDRLESLLIKYPNAPKLHIQVIIAYRQLEQKQREVQLAKLTLKKFPGYLFSKIQIAQIQLNHGQDYKKLPETFKHQYLLTDIYPNRNLFHLTEYAGLYICWIEYFMKTGQNAAAWQMMMTVMNNPHYDGYYLRHMKSHMQQFLVEFAMQGLRVLVTANQLPAMKATLIGSLYQ